MIVLAGTGHRPQFAETGKLKAFSDEMEIAMNQTVKAYYSKLAPDLVISGGAIGWDLAIARIAALMGIPYRMYIPCIGHGSNWPSEQFKRFEIICEKAESVRIITQKPYSPQLMIIRDKAMVNDATLILALWSGIESGGTYKTVKYAESLDKRVVNAWQDYEKRG